MPLPTISLKTRLIIAASVLLILVLVVFTCGKKKKAEVKKITTVEKMQEFVDSISVWAKQNKPGFLIIPQNGIELAFDDANPKHPMNRAYLQAIDGFGVEELFYYEDLTIDTLRLNALQRLVKEKKVLVSDFVASDGHVADAKKRNTDEGFIPFVRSKSNYHYHKIPEKVINENDLDIRRMADVRNYLYLINPEDYDTKEAFVKAVEKTNFDLVTIDLYYDNNEPFTANDIQRMKTKANGGKRLVVCYMNIGAAENWRYYWKAGWRLHAPEFLERSYDGYENEVWVKYWDPQWQKIIYGNKDSYLKKIIDAGFDGTYLDNTEAYYELYKK